MNRFGTRNKFATGYLLLALLLAQAGSFGHAWQHDPGAPQGQACAACASATQLSSACVDGVQFPLVIPLLSAPITHREVRFEPVEPMAFRSRGPPSTA